MFSFFAIFRCALPTLGVGTFYADILLTNKNYGTGAVFPANVWVNTGLQQMRVDYLNASRSLFMSVYYNYATKDQYQICNGVCARATWAAPMPLFLGTVGTNYAAAVNCETPDYPGPRACVPSCRSYLTSPNQPTGIYSQSFNDTDGVNLCLVRFTPGSGFSFGPEWQIQRYVTSNFATQGVRPDLASTYYVPNNGSCPQPSCFAVMDIAFVIDESGSIDNTEFALLQQFIRDIIAQLTMAQDKVRAGLVYFSGFDNCNSNQTNNIGATTSCDSGCASCGGLWKTETTAGVIADKTNFIKLVNAHNQQKGFTCISCGMDAGTQILNRVPKANVQKVIILMTDGVQNRVTGSLAKVSKIAYDQQIITYAIGIDKFQMSDLLAVTSADKIFNVTNFGLLNTILNQIIRPLCQPLPNIETCNFCSGLCSCSTTCNCPSCDDYNACTNDNCNIAQPPIGTAGQCTYTNVICPTDNDVCTLDLCDSKIGCYYNTTTPKPPNMQDSFCIAYQCNPLTGYQPVDVGSSKCSSNDPCFINYCNTTTNNCVSFNRVDVLSGTSVTFRNSASQTITVSGCGKPPSAPPCSEYRCDSNNGLCVVDNSKCNCLTNANCNDFNGCTTDFCDLIQNKCIYTPIDCFSIASSGQCTSGSANAIASSVTGLAYYNGASSSVNATTNMPTPLAQARSCDALACYGGQRSTYSCVSLSDYGYQCRRQTTACTSSSCLDSICTSLGGWTNGQLSTDCSTTRSRTCSDGLRCTSDVCSTTWQGVSCQNSGSCVSQSGGNRCLFPSNATNCIDTSVCTYDLCSNTTGCSNPNRPLQQVNGCLNPQCNAQTGNYTNINTGACTPNADKCVIRYCNTSRPIGQECVEINKRTIPLGTTQFYVDSDGSTKGVTGCQKPTAGCFEFGCDALTGLCFTNTSTCGCLNDAQCNDGNGCTYDACNTTSFECVYTNVDCYNISSNGACKAGNTFTATNGTSWSLYTLGTNYNPSIVNNPFAPNPNYDDCDKLACFNGERSTYTCQSLSNTTFKCVRNILSVCPKGGCVDTLCRSLGSWTNGIADTSCGVSVTYQCPGNKCNTAVCNTGFVFTYGTTASRCILTSNATNCVNNNPCIKDGQCDDLTGCLTNVPTDNPTGINNNTCTSVVCNPSIGWTVTDIGDIACPTLANQLCTPKYCDPTKLLNGCTGSDCCTVIDREQIYVGQSVTYVNSAGETKIETGCAFLPDPSDPLVNCKRYNCNPNDGSCTVDSSNCLCLSNSTCSDGNGCTFDYCDFSATITGKVECVHIPIDCYSELSNGQCISFGTSQTPLTQDDSIGWLIYNGSAPSGNVYTQVDSNGLPFPSTGVSRTCQELACYNGEPSTYTCFSIEEGQHTCQRVSSKCTLNGCQDTICRSLANWSGSVPQIDSDCGSSYVPNCADLDSCTVDQCNSTWDRNDINSQRCIHTLLNATSVCDDGNFCTLDYCDSQDTTGDFCRHNLYSTSYLKKKICKTNETCTNVKCTVNRCIYTTIECLAPTSCQIFVCNQTTKGVCAAFDYGVYKIDRCGVCGGNGLSCIPDVPIDPKKTSIIVALAVGLSIGLCFAAAIIAILTRTGYSAYQALATEIQGTVTTSSTYQGGDDHVDTSHYNRD